MPKIRDLGINVIPMTMRPPEIGRGGGYQLGADCANSCEGTFTCPEPSLPNCVPSCDPGTVTCPEPSIPDCVPSCNGTFTCPEPSLANCVPSCNGTFTCPEPSLPNCVPSCAPSSRPRHAGGLTPDAIAQLKQQLQNQLHQ